MLSYKNFNIKSHNFIIVINLWGWMITWSNPIWFWPKMTYKSYWNLGSSNNPASIDLFTRLFSSFLEKTLVSQCIVQLEHNMCYTFLLINYDTDILVFWHPNAGLFKSRHQVLFSQRFTNHNIFLFQCRTVLASLLCILPSCNFLSFTKVCQTLFGYELINIHHIFPKIALLLPCPFI